MEKLNQNSNFKGIGYKFHEIRAQIVCDEHCDPSELELFLGFLQDLAKAIMAQSAILRGYHGFYNHTLNGLERDLEETNREIDQVQKILVQYRVFEGN